MKNLNFISVLLLMRPEQFNNSLIRMLNQGGKKLNIKS